MQFLPRILSGHLKKSNCCSYVCFPQKMKLDIEQANSPAVCALHVAYVENSVVLPYGQGRCLSLFNFIYSGIYDAHCFHS